MISVSGPIIGPATFLVTPARSRVLLAKLLRIVRGMHLGSLDEPMFADGQAGLQRPQRLPARQHRHPIAGERQPGSNPAADRAGSDHADLHAPLYGGKRMEPPAALKMNLSCRPFGHWSNQGRAWPRRTALAEMEPTHGRSRRAMTAD